MSEKPIVRFPNGQRSVWHSVRLVFYVRIVMHLLPVPASAAYLTYWQAKEASRSGNYGDFAICFVFFWGLAVPSLVLLCRVLFGRRQMKGMLAIAETAKQWQTTWQSIEVASEEAKYRAIQSRAVFALPDSREQFDGLLPGSAYQAPEELLSDLPLWPDYVTFGNVINQPVQAIDTRSAEHAAMLVRRIGSIIAGRVLCKDLPVVAFKAESTTSLRLMFLTDVQVETPFHGYVWLTVNLQVDGTMVVGFVETVRTLFVGQNTFVSGHSYRGDEHKAKFFGRLLWESAVALSPCCFLLAPKHFWNSCLEIFDARHSAWFFSRYRPQAGASVDLFLIGEAGSEISSNDGFVSSVESVRNDLMKEVHQVVGTFGGMLT